MKPPEDSHLLHGLGIGYATFLDVLRSDKLGIDLGYVLDIMHEGKDGQIGILVIIVVEDALYAGYAADVNDAMRPELTKFVTLKATESPPVVLSGILGIHPLDSKSALLEYDSVMNMREAVFMGFPAMDMRDGAKSPDDTGTETIKVCTSGFPCVVTGPFAAIS
jgi:hypothetical protein